MNVLASVIWFGLGDEQIDLLTYLLDKYNIKLEEGKFFPYFQHPGDQENNLKVLKFFLQRGLSPNAV
jgi:hypothetical protein